MFNDIIPVPVMLQKRSYNSVNIWWKPMMWGFIFADKDTNLIFPQPTQTTQLGRLVGR